jgi:hypothetical protein
VFNKLAKILDQNLPAYTWAIRPDHLKTRSEWKRSLRKVTNGEEPIARLTWEAMEWRDGVGFLSDGSATEIKEQRSVVRECPLFGDEQTSPYKPSLRTRAIEKFRGYFVEFTSREHHIYWADPADKRWLKIGWPFRGEKKPGWKSGTGRLTDELLKQHLNGKGRYGVRGHMWTRYMALDLDLHNGDPEVFLEQLQVLLAEFHGKDGWHYQVSEKNAGGIHLIRCFAKPRLVSEVRAELEQRLQALDRRHPELASRALAAGMNPFNKVEIFPHHRKGFRLPLCSGRTMLLDRPLPLVFNKRMGRHVQDVIRYIAWISREQKKYMPLEEVVSYIKDRLAAPKPKVQPKNSKALPKPSTPPGGGMAELGPMKGQYARKLVDIWTGKSNLPDSLNQGIVLLARVLPYYLDKEEDAFALIEKYIDELPNWTFSDRLSGGNRAEVSRLVRNTVRTVYHGNGGQADPGVSTTKLQATVGAWNKRGFDPTDKGTWNRAVITTPNVTDINFFWKPEDVIKLGQLQAVLNSTLDSVSTAMKTLISLVKRHNGEISITLVATLLESCGIACRHHGKANAVMRLLCQWEWLYIRAWERWYPVQEDGTKRPGRARCYGVGAEMAGKFDVRTGNNTHNTKYLCIVSHHTQPPKPIVITFETIGSEICLGWP